jgi:hypothetical protein
MGEEMKTAIVTSFCVLCAACGAREASDEIKDALATPTPTPAVEAQAEPEEQQSSDRQESVKLEKVDPKPTPTPTEKIIVVIQPSPAPQHTPEEIAERRQAFYVQCFKAVLPGLLETNESQVARRGADDICKIWRQCSVEKLFSTADGWPIN